MYKRQDPGALNGVAPERLSAHAKATGVAFKPMQVATQSNKAVSYTHLDVYKRQPY